MVGNGALKELTYRYEGLIKSYGVDEWGAKRLRFQGIHKRVGINTNLP
jgi:hypothetical protein